MNRHASVKGGVNRNRLSFTSQSAALVPQPVVQEALQEPRLSTALSEVTQVIPSETATVNEQQEDESAALVEQTEEVHPHVLEQEQSFEESQ